MIYAILVVLGLCFGSFVNALVWRVHEKRDWVKERSECVHCHHVLAGKDLLPVVSWLWLRGKCRYCRKPISVQYPAVEAATAILFVMSYMFWPHTLHGVQWEVFGLWLVTLIGLMALTVYDLRWMLLPNKFIFPLLVVATAQALLLIVTAQTPVHTLTSYLAAIAVGGGIFYVLFQVSKGKWIGGGDVKLGFLLGLLVGTAEKSLLLIFVAALLGSLVSLPLLVTKRLGKGSTIPFGPFLIVGGCAALLFGDSIIHWYNHSILLIN